MRKLNVLNVNREPVGLDVPFSLLDGHTLREVYEDGVVVDLTDEDDAYFQAMYDYLKYGTEVEGKTYLPAGNLSKHDVAYTNKTNDIPYSGLGGKTLNDMFYESRNMLVPSKNYGHTLVSGTIYEIFNANGIVITFDYSNGHIEVNGTNTYGATLFISYLLTSYVPVSSKYSAQLHYISGTTDGDVQVGLGNSDGGLPNRMVIDGTTLLDVYVDGNIPTLNNYMLLRIGDGLTYTNFKFTVEQEFGHIHSPYQVPSENYSTEEFPSSFTEQDISDWFDKYEARKNITKRELTYADIFEKNQVFGNPEFEDETQWSGENVNSLEFVDGIAYVEGVMTGGYSRIRDYSTEMLNKQMYIKYKARFTYCDGITSGFSWRVNIDGSYQSIAGISTPAEGQWYEQSAISNGLVNNASSYLQVNGTLAANINYEFEYAYAVILDIFDEDITQSIIDNLLNTYLGIRNKIIYPNIYLITEPIGLGKRYKMLSVGDYIYGHELDFQEISFKMLFGINYNAYEAYNLMVDMLKDDECTIEYDWGKGSRFADVRLLEAPKTEKEANNLLTNKWRFQLLKPFYQLKSYESGSLINESHLAVDLFLTITNLLDSAISISFENDETEEVDFKIAFDLSSLATQPTTIYIDSEKKKIYDNLGRNLYEYLDLVNGDSSFISLDSEASYTPSSTDCDVAIDWKHWVVD